MEKLAKYAQDLERYETIVNYFNGNPSRITTKGTVSYLHQIYDSLIMIYPEKIDVSDEDIQEKVHMICADKESNYIYSKSRELGDKLQSINFDSLLKKITRIKNEKIGSMIKG